MNRFFTVIFSLLFISGIGLSQHRITQENLDQLDEEIKKKHIYDNIKHNTIDSLKNITYSSAKISNERYNASFMLGKEYETFISDSALFYFEQAHDIAVELNDTTKMLQSRLGRVKVLAILGYFKESVTELNSVEEFTIADEIKDEWLDTGRQLFAYMTTYALDNENLFNRYIKKLNTYRDNQLENLDKNTPEYKLFLAEHFLAKGELNNAKLLFHELINEIPDNSNIYARAAHNMATIKQHEKQDDVAAYYLSLSAISDIKCSVKENLSIQELAIYLYNQGDIERAYTYISSSLADAVFCNARLRTAEVSKIIPLIDGAYKSDLEQQRQTLLITNILMGLLSIGLIILIIVVLRQMEKVKSARQKLKQANKIKEDYIGHFLDICSIYMERLDNFNKIVTRKITAGQVEELLKMAKSSKFTEGQQEQFYDIFDATFLHIYPTFIDEFNDLLIPEERIIITEPGRLTTELRIYALLRMGVEDSTKIASFLHYSVNTIYTYRNKIKNKAKNRDTFEENIMKIGSIS